MKRGLSALVLLAVLLAGARMGIAQIQGAVQNPYQNCLGYEGEGKPGALMKVEKDFTGIRMTDCFAIQESQVRVRGPFGSQQQTVLDSLGRIQNTIDPMGNTAVFQYDNQSRYHRISVPAIENRHWFGERDSSFSEFGYDSVGNLQRVDSGSAQDANLQYMMNATRYNPDDMTDASYDQSGRGTCVAERDAAGRPELVRFDGIEPGSGECTNPAGQVRYHYDQATGLLNSIEDAAGNLTEVVERDDFNRPEVTRFADGTRLELRYNKAGFPTRRLLRGTDGTEVSRVVTQYDVMGRVTEQSELGPGRLDYTTRYEYVENEPGQTRIVTRTPSLAGWESFEELASTTVFDLLDRPTRVEKALEPVVTYRYDDANRQVFARNEGLGLETRTSFDVAGRIARVKSPSGNTVDFAYDSQGALSSLFQKSSENSVGLETRYYRDIFGRVRRVERVNDRGVALPVSFMEYDENRNLTSLRMREGDVLPYRWDFEYNHGPQKWLSAVVAPVGRRREITGYTSRGDVRSATDARGFVWTYDYDVMGRLTDIVAHGGGFEYHREMEYNARGEMIAVTGSKTATGFAGLFDFCLLSKAWDSRDESPCSNRVDFAIDSLGNVLEEAQVINMRERRVVNTPTPLGTLSNIRYPSGTEVTLAQDDAGHLTGIAAGDENAQLPLMGFNYDAATGRYLSFEHADGTVTELEYNRFGNWMGWKRGEGMDLIAEERVNRRQEGEKIYRQFRELGIGLRDLGVPDRRRPIVAHWTARTARAFGRDVFERLVSVNSPRNVVPRMDEDILYHDNDRLFTEGDAVADGLLGFEYGNETNGVDYIYLGHFAGGIGNVTHLTYRNDGQLQRISRNERCSDRNIETCEGEEDLLEFAVDGNGNIIQVLRHSGHFVEGGGYVVTRRPVREYTYDPWNRLEKAVILGNPKMEIRYEYDGLDRLIRRRVFEEHVSRNWLGQESVTWVFIRGQEFTWSGNRVLEMRHSTSAGRSEGVVTRYVHDLGNTPRFAVGDDSQGEYILGMDGSVLGVRNPGEAEVGNGGYVEWYEYGPFGKVKAYDQTSDDPAVAAVAEGEELLSPFLYRGNFYDEVTGFYYDGSGWYDGELGRYLTRDPSGPSAGSLNLYVPTQDPI